MSSKQTLIDTAAVLFANQGFEATTTVQIAREAGITEPMIYYHFKGKDDLFQSVLAKTFERYFDGLDSLRDDGGSAFESLRQLIDVHMDIVRDAPEAVRLIVSSCPARLHDPEGVCARKYREAYDFLKNYLVRCLTRGTETGEFAAMPVAEVTELIIAMINGILRRGISPLTERADLREAAVAFCRRALTHPAFPQKR